MSSYIIIELHQCLCGSNASTWP